MPEAVAPESVAYTHEFTVDASYQRALTRALYLSQFRSPVTWILLGVILIFFGLSVLGGLNAFVAVWLILLALVWGLRYFRVRSMVRRSFPVGKVMRSGFTPTHFGVSDGDNSSVLAYSGFDSIDVGADVVWLRRITPRRRFAYPGALFPSVEVERIRAAIADAQLS